ncbi:hypothetical protein [uncultured Citrobacter sp.]|uniref:hypothetical protein n=1 Tax=uncultured Citrobacter sp. TaxID=200446 RepID=UPI00280B46DE|nr:hypothetical protein [uncultured Citrobacter sp.]MDU5156056.1 hypothetical protein [Citrobacter sp.]
MNKIHYLTAATTLSLLSFSTMAQTVTAVDSTIEGAEEKISTLATKEGKSYEILGASFKNRVYMTAELTPVNKK